jgi:hypothetical protein
MNTLQEECDRLEEQIGEHTYLTRTITGWGNIIYKLDYVGHGVGEYLSEHYSSVSTMCSGQVRCEDWAEAKLFLTLLLERYTSGGSVDPQIPEKIAECMNFQGWRDAIYYHVGCSDISDLPIRDAELPSWIIEQMPVTKRWWESEHFLYTLNVSDAYLSYPSEDLPEVQGCLLVLVVGEDSESHVELGSKESNQNDSFEQYWGVAGDSLEAFLALQMVCHNKNLAKEFPRTAFIRYALVGGVWLRPIPEAIKSFVDLRDAKYGLFYPNFNLDDQDEKIALWLERVEAAIDEDTEDEIAALIRKTRSEY